MNPWGMWAPRMTGDPISSAARRRLPGAPRGALPLLVALAAASGAASGPPAERPASPQRRGLPDGCSADLSGLWRHAEDDRYLYRAQDDGGTLTVAILRADAGPAPAAALVLQRSSGGFVGAVAVARPSADGGCVAFFPAEVVSCADGGLDVSTVPRLRLDPACRPSEAVPPPVVHRLVRLPGDGGV